jgi:hypothetical protein
MPLIKGLFCLLLLASHAAHALDIAGVALGSNAAEARAAVSKVNPKFQFSSIRLPGGKGTGFVAKESGHPAIHGPNAGLYDEFVVLLDDAGKVWYLVRNVNTSSENRIVHRDLIREFTQKYGGPSNRSWLIQETITWARYRSGKMYIGAADQGPCGLPVLKDVISGTTVKMPSPLKTDCGTLVVASVPRASVDEKVASYSISMVDAKALQDGARKPDENLR